MLDETFVGKISEQKAIGVKLKSFRTGVVTGYAKMSITKGDPISAH